MTENVDSFSPSSPKPRAPKPPTELSPSSSSAKRSKWKTSPNLPKIADFQSTDPVEGNPFPVATPRYEVWKRATLTGEAELHRLNANFLQGGSTDFVQFDGRTIAMTAAKFDIWAKRAIQVVWDDQDLRVYDAWLSSYGNAWLKAFEPRLRNHLPVFRTELHRILLGRVEYWRSEARRYRAEQEKRPILAESADSKIPVQNHRDRPPKENGPAKRLEANSPKNPRARGISQFTRAVRKALVSAPGASGLEICRSVDEDGLAPTPRMNGCCYEDTYQNDRCAAKGLDSRFSKIRNQMKSEGILT